MMAVPNRFLRSSDLQDQKMSALKTAFDSYYKAWRGPSHTFGAKFPEKIVTHWSREWEYPWAVINCEPAADMKILDCGCGGSPLLPFLTGVYHCQGFGIDMNHGDRFVPDQESYLKNTQFPLANLRNFFIDPALIVKNITVQKGNMMNLPYHDSFFDRVLCISVIEHMKKADCEKAVGEMVRVLKTGGKLLITMDHTGYNGHFIPWGDNPYLDVIRWSGLKLCGDHDFTVPDMSEIHGMYHVVGFILKKE